MRPFYSFTLLVAFFCVSQQGISQILTPDKHDNPAGKNWAIHSALGYTSNYHQAFYSLEYGFTYSNKWFGLHFKNEISADDLFRKKAEEKGEFIALPDFMKRYEIGTGINLYSRRGNATCFRQLMSSESDGIITELWQVGDGEAVVYGQIRFGMGKKSITNETEAIYAAPQYYEPGDNWHLHQDSSAYIHVHTPYYYVGWSKVKKFNKECGNDRIGVHKLYFDFLFGKPEINGIYNNNANGLYPGLYPLMTYARSGWRIGYEAVRMNAFSGYLSLEAGYYPGLRDASLDDGLLFATMRLGFSSAPYRKKEY